VDLPYTYNNRRNTEIDALSRLISVEEECIFVLEEMGRVVVIVEGEVKKLKEGEEVIGSIYLRVLLLWLRLESLFIGLCMV
jgi:hypothetical protein